MVRFVQLLFSALVLRLLPCCARQVIGWTENVVSRHFYYLQKSSLYSQFGFLKLQNNYPLHLHEQADHEMQFEIPKLQYGSLFPMTHYLFVMRLFYADEEGMEYLWTLQQNTSVPILSVDNEREVLLISSQRLLDLVGDLSHKDGTPGDKEKSRYLLQLYITTQIATTLLEQSISKYIPRQRRNNRNSVSGESCLKYFDKLIADMSMSLRERHSERFSSQTAKTKTEDTAMIKRLIRLYIHESVVPYLNRILPIPTSDIKESATPVVLSSVLTTYTAEEEHYESKLVVIERQYDNFSASALLLSLEENVEQAVDIGAVVKKSSRILFCTDRDIPDEKNLLNIHGYGAFSISTLECLTHYNVSNCFSVKTALNVYNSVVASPVLSLLPVWIINQNVSQRSFDSPVQRVLKESRSIAEAVDSLIEHERSLGRLDPSVCGPPSETTPRVLILGLAAGELHMFLLQHFPCLVIDSVEISGDLFAVSQEVIGGTAYGVCSAQRLNISSNTLEPVPLFDPSRSECVDDVCPSGLIGECRSSVFIADAWDFISHRVEVNKDSESSLYDLIMFDVYDTKATFWTGEVGGGESSPFVDRAASDTNLQNVRSLLTKGRGLAVFHLHRDRNFAYYYSRISAMFGADQVVLLSVMANDYMVVAGKDLFRIPPHLVASNSVQNSFTKKHPCEHPLDFAAEAVRVGEAYQFSRKVALASRFSLTCEDKRDYFEEVRTGEEDLEL